MEGRASASSGDKSPLMHALEGQKFSAERVKKKQEYGMHNLYYQPAKMNLRKVGAGGAHTGNTDAS